MNRLPILEFTIRLQKWDEPCTSLSPIRSELVRLRYKCRSVMIGGHWRQRTMRHFTCLLACSLGSFILMTICGGNLWAQQSPVAVHAGVTYVRLPKVDFEVVRSLGARISFRERICRTTEWSSLLSSASASGNAV